MGSGSYGLPEAFVANLFQSRLECLPIEEINPLFVNPVDFCTEFKTPAGTIDNLLVAASGFSHHR